MGGLNTRFYTYLMNAKNDDVMFNTDIVRHSNYIDEFQEFLFTVNSNKADML